MNNHGLLFLLYFHLVDLYLGQCCDKSHFTTLTPPLHGFCRLLKALTQQTRLKNTRFFVLLELSPYFCIREDKLHVSCQSDELKS